MHALSYPFDAMKNEFGGEFSNFKNFQLNECDV